MTCLTLQQSSVSVRMPTGRESTTLKWKLQQGVTYFLFGHMAILLNGPKPEACWSGRS